MFSYVDRILHKAIREYRDYVIAGILCVIAILVISHAYFPGAIAVVALTMIFDYFGKRDWKSIGYYLIVAFFVAAAGIVYIATYSFAQFPSSIVMQGSGVFEKIGIALKCLLIMAGAILYPQNLQVITEEQLHLQNSMLVYIPYYFLGAFIMLTSIVSAVIYFRGGKQHKTYMPLMMTGYGYCTMMIIAFIRIKRFGLFGITSSRYVVETTMILVGNLWMLISILADCVDRKEGKYKKRLCQIAGGLIILTCIGIVGTDVFEWHTAPWRKLSFKTMAYNMFNIDSVTDEDLVIAQSSAENVREAVEVFRKYELSVFADVKYSEELQALQHQKPVKP